MALRQDISHTLSCHCHFLFFFFLQCIRYDFNSEYNKAMGDLMIIQGQPIIASSKVRYSAFLHLKLTLGMALTTGVG